jgi:sugar O-acyltransferase (sialic acid O-acetyltransferase NeuD family)
MGKDSILLVGAGGHAKVCIDVIQQEGRFSIKGLVGLPHEVENQVLGYSVLGKDEDLPELIRDCTNVLITIGQVKTPKPRILLYDLIHKNSCTSPVIVSPHAYVSPHASIGEGTIVMHGAIINAAAVVGENCIINSQALIEHDVVIKDHCHIATAATINSGVYVGNGTFIGSNSVVRQCAKIGENCLIGMGQNILTDCDDWVCIPNL